MQKLCRTSAWVLTCFVLLIASALPAFAQPYYALEYYGGPVLEHFTIYPLYYGDWSTADIDAQQAYLRALAAYISGDKAPAGTQPMIRQYGVLSASVADHVTADPTAKPNTSETYDQLVSIIKANQKNGKLPAFSSTTLIAVFLAHGFQLSGCDGCAYHASLSSTAFWLVVPHDTGAPYQLSTAHEVMESATDPEVDDQTAWGWLTGGYYPKGSSQLAYDEMIDECGNNTITLTNLGIQIPEGMDNSGGVSLGNPAENRPPGGTCSTTGYTSLSETQVYGWTYSDYRTKYNQLWTEGWRLYILQSYELPNGGGLRYNAVWRPAGNTAEIQQYGATYAEFRANYDKLWPLGWRIYILDSFVEGGNVHYNAVWRPGDVAETQLYGIDQSELSSQITTKASEQWRLRLLQAYVPSGSAEYTAVWRAGVTAEDHVLGDTYDEYRTEYNKLWDEGWRLYLLQSYLLPDGTELFDAVFHHGNHDEIQYYGATYAEYRSEYNSLWPNGWRLYILQSFVGTNGTVYYNAVWRKSMIDRPL
jgi:hypothetical protein